MNVLMIRDRGDATRLRADPSRVGSSHCPSPRSRLRRSAITRRASIHRLFVCASGRRVRPLNWRRACGSHWMPKWMRSGWILISRPTS